MRFEKSEFEVLIESPWMLSVAILKYFRGSSESAYVCMTPQRLYRLRGRNPDEPFYKGEDQIIKTFGNVGTWNHNGVEREIEKMKLRYPMKLMVVA